MDLLSRKDLKSCLEQVVYPMKCSFKISEDEISLDIPMNIYDGERISSINVLDNVKSTILRNIFDIAKQAATISDIEEVNFEIATPVKVVADCMDPNFVRMQVMIYIGLKSKSNSLYMFCPGPNESGRTKLCRVNT